MDEMKWAWVLFVAASLAVLIRLSLWFLPSPMIRHSEKVSEAAEAAPVVAPVAPVVEAPAVAPEATVWPNEAEEREDGPSPAPPEMSPAISPPAPAEPAPEEFHFRQTRWGMAIEEVRASEPGEPLRESDRGLLYVTTTHEMPCLLTYSFVQGRLVRARLSFSDPAGKDIPPLSVAQAQRRFLYLREQLRARYGEPIQNTVHMPRDVSDLRRSVQRQDELAQQYDTEIAEAEQRLKQQTAVLETRFARWSNKAEMIARDLVPYERDLRELRTWKQEALDRAEQSRRSIEQHQTADFTHPLVATMTARWPYARELHDIELKLDCRSTEPRLDIRYEGSSALPEIWQMHEL